MEMVRKNKSTMKGRKKNKDNDKDKKKSKSKRKRKDRKIKSMISKGIIQQNIQSSLESIISPKRTKITLAYLELTLSKDNS